MSVATERYPAEFGKLLGAVTGAGQPVSSKMSLGGSALAGCFAATHTAALCVAGSTISSGMAVGIEQLHKALGKR